MAQKLRERGISSEVYLLHDTSVSEIVDSLRRSDLILYHRIQAERLLVPCRWTCLYLLGRLERPVIFDFDDSIQLDFPVLTDFCVKASNAVTVGSHELHLYSRRLNQNTYLIPSAVDTNIYKPADDLVRSRFEKRDDSVVIGWHGSVVSHWRNLLVLKDVLRRLRQQLRARIVLRLIGGPFTSSLAGQFEGIVPVQSGPDRWIEYEELPRYISGVDIGVYPLNNTRRTRAKCSMKMIEQMAMGIPVVASAVGENNYITTDGYDGFLAHDSEEWINRLQTLIENPELRGIIGGHAREKILRRYSLDIVTSRIVGVFDSLIG